ncbi:peptidoglycan DD-metalloendopeptidase family protein [Mollicutes bacterium LVI A0078]|nr:peptidoglycan DD-metalloendopeptidase family protein [Mollicutes bacterium LVI A0075]WOO90646.1 peptidoglycan DD-metalloendopeptidase family protein [Mollicutes bacterium LVI A0078]
MQTSDKNKINAKLLISKIALFAFVLLLLFTYSSQESNNQNFELNQAAFLYEGNELVGVNTDDRALELEAAQKNKAAEVKAAAGVTDPDTALSTKVINTPSLIKFNLTDEEQVELIDYAKQQTKVLEQGYTLTVDDKYKYYIKDKETVEWTIEKILLAYLPDKSYLDYYQSTGKFKTYTQGDKKFTGISINNDIKVTEGYSTGSLYIENQEDLLFNLFHKDQNKTYDIISDSASIKSIKNDNDMNDTVFKINNPNLADNTVTYNGQQIITNDLDPVIEAVQTFETVESETIDFDTVQEVDESMLTGQFEVKTEGEEGKKEITYENKMVNGEVVSTEKVNEEVTEKPVHKVILVGDGQVTNSVTVNGSGTSSTDSTSFSNSNASASASGFIWPSSGTRVTCQYGCYSGHVGIDIQSYYGGPIYAAKDGMVVTSGWSNYGYGYHVVIDHGNGVKTLYAHQNQPPPVSVGQYVSQGQMIGYEGATGNVTGEHLHFEVQINGTAVNPYPYIA